MLFDSHTHLNLAAFDSDRDLLLKRYLKEDIFMVNVGTCLETSQQALAISGEYSNCWASVGLHPSHTLPALLDPMEIAASENNSFVAQQDEQRNQNLSKPETFDENYLELLKNPKVVALGECGLDYSYLKTSHEKNKRKIKSGKSRNLERKSKQPKSIIYH